MSACAPTIPVFNGKEISRHDVDTLRRGITTKQQLLNLFGMPIAIAVRGENLLLKEPAQWHGSRILLGQVTERQSDPFFELFANGGMRDGKYSEDYRVYYYMYSISHGMAIILVSYIREESKLDVDQLWVLVNERSGIVEDYVFRPAPEKEESVEFEGQR